MPTHVLTPDPDTLELDAGFVVATGIECSAPLVARRLRQDELRKTGHWERYVEDFRLVSEFGIRYLRYGIPFHVVDHVPGRFDWEWTDRAMDALQQIGLVPIADLLHFGVPDDLNGIGDPRLPDRFAAYVAAFVERFPWVRYYTPVNEPLVTAVMSAGIGWWNERLREQSALVAAIDNVAACAARGMQIIRAARPDAVFIQSDACEGYTAEHPLAQPGTDFLNERRFVTFDLTYGRRPAESVVSWLDKYGFGEERLAWFAQRGSSEGCVIGHDYYRGNEWLVRPDGSTRHATGDLRRGYAALAREYHQRYALPFMLSETNIAGPKAPAWLAEVWNDALQLRHEGLPIRGFCWYGFVDHVDWDSALRRNVGRTNTCGLVGLDRRAHTVGEQYKLLAHSARAGSYQPMSTTAGRARRRGREKAA